VATLLHEAWEPSRAERGHTSGEEAGTIAAEAGASRLLITHNHPLPGVAERTAEAAQARFDAALSAVDRAILDL
jgi:ribonuclease BN (tRNA processing enzyme)